MAIAMWDTPQLPLAIDVFVLNWETIPRRRKTCMLVC